MQLAVFNPYRQPDLAAQVFERDLANKFNVDLADVGIKHRQTELFCQRFDDVALFDHSHLDQHFADPFRFACPLLR